MLIDASTEQQQNAESAIQDSLTGDSKVTDERECDFRKQDWPTFSTEEGTQMDTRHDCENAESPRHDSLEPDANGIVERILHPAKQFLPICPTEEGMQIDNSEGQSKNAESPIDRSRKGDSKVTLESV
jgi:hypothetical protein